MCFSEHHWPAERARCLWLSTNRKRPRNPAALGRKHIYKYAEAAMVGCPSVLCTTQNQTHKWSESSRRPYRTIIMGWQRATAWDKQTALQRVSIWPPVFIHPQHSDTFTECTQIFIQQWAREQGWRVLKWRGKLTLGGPWSGLMPPGDKSNDAGNAEEIMRQARDPRPWWSLEERDDPTS